MDMFVVQKAGPHTWSQITGAADSWGKLVWITGGPLPGEAGVGTALTRRFAPVTSVAALRTIQTFNF